MVRVSSELFRSSAAITASLLLVCVLNACSLKNQAQSQTVQISFPQSKSTAHSKMSPKLVPGPHATGASGTSSENPVPQVFTDFNCYAVNVIGADIPTDPRLACGDPTQGLGVIAGFVSVDTPSITLSVPNGTARQIQLLGVDSVEGCPDLNDLLDNMNSFNGISQPYLLASTTVDVLADTSVSLTAAFNPISPQIMFQGCGGDGPQYPVAQGFTGYQTVTATSDNQAVPVAAVVGNPAPVATPGTNGSDLLGALALTPAQLQSIAIGGDGSTPVLTSGLYYSAYNPTSTFRRAFIQLQFDATNFNLAKFPYGKLQMQVRGGQDDGCAFNSNYGVAVSVFDQAQSSWVALAQNNYYSGTAQWGWGGGVIPDQISNLLVTKSTNGHQYVVVNVESNFPGISATCPSAVRIAQASLQLLPSMTSGNGNSGNNQMYLGSTALSGNTTMYAVGYGSPAAFYPSGGTPPYSYSATAGSFDTHGLGLYSAPGTGSTAVVTITDSTGLTANSTVALASSSTSTPQGVTLIPMTNGPFTAAPIASSCVPFTAITTGFGGSSPTVSGTVTLSFQGTSGAINAYSSSACGGTTVPTITSGQSQATTFYLNLDDAGTESPGIGITSGLTPILSPGFLSIPVSAGPFSAIYLVGPDLINANACVPYDLVTADAAGNEVTTTQSSTVSSLPTGFYSDSGCSTTPIASTTLSAGVTSKTIYFTHTSGTVSLPATASGTPITPSFDLDLDNASTTISVVAAGTPVQFQLAIDSTTPVPDSYGCIEIDLTTVDINGNAQNIPSGTESATISGAPNTYTSKGICDSPGTSTTPQIAAGLSETTFWINVGMGTTIQALHAVSPSTLDASNSLTIN